jgi:type IV pilus assembly protein PilE
MKCTQRGMTLVELMIVVVIVSILAAVAVPGYRNYMLRTYRSEAKSALLQIQAAQEKFYLQNNRYSRDLTQAPPNGLGLLNATENNKYQLAVQFRDGTDQTYTATATPLAAGGQTADTLCPQFSVDETGARTPASTGTTAQCWR